MNPSASHPHTPSFPHPGSSLYYALAAVPRAQRLAISLWLQWWHETAQIPLAITDPGVAETKLRWWQQELRDAAAGQPHHPILKGLMAPGVIHGAAVLPAWSIWQTQLEGLVQLINQTRWLDDASLQQHARMTTGAAMEGAACLLGASSDEAGQAAHLLGCGLRQAHRLARLGQDARAGWVHVAIDTLQAHEVRAHQLSKPDRTQVPEGWPRLLAHLAEQATQSLQQGLAAVKALPPGEARALRPLCVLAHVHLQQVQAIASQGDRVLHERIMLTPLRKWWISQQVRWGWLA
jgi:phytoene synthase